MKNESLLEKVKLLGVPLMESGKKIDANATLVEVVRSPEIRYWEIFPVLLAHSANKGLFEHTKVKGSLNPKEKRIFNDLVLLSLVLYRALDLTFPWAEPLFWSHVGRGQKEFDQWLDRFVKRETFSVGGKDISPDRLVSIFRSYYRPAETENLKDLLTKKEELGLEYALSQIFTPRQKELFLKKARGERLSKSEREYFSRTIKKKALALANEQLHQLARNI